MRTRSFEKAVDQCSSIKAQMDLIDSFLPLAKTEGDKARVLLWCEVQRTKALSNLKTPTKEDVPVILDVLRTKGMQFFIDE